MFQRALIVDDSVPIHGLIKAQLDRHGLEFHSAYSGEAALSMAADIWPDVILLDIDLPGIDGFEVCRRLKSDAVMSKTPVIFVTADFAEQDVAKGFELGAADYVTKPFRPEDLTARVESSLRRKQMLDVHSMIDPVTGLWSEGYLQAHVAAEMSIGRPVTQPVACIMIDVDGLELINRRHGRLFGDRVLRALGNILLTECRAADVVAHMGGGQFAIFVPGKTRAAAARVAERLCGHVRQQLLYHDGKEIGLRCSFGVADGAVLGGVPLIDRAEQALNRAKQNGGDCVSIARPPRGGPRSAA